MKLRQAMGHRGLGIALVLLSVAVSCDAFFGKAAAKNVKVYRVFESMKDEPTIVVPMPKAKGNMQDFLDLIESKVSYLSLMLCV